MLRVLSQTIQEKVTPSENNVEEKGEKDQINLLIKKIKKMIFLQKINYQLRIVQKTKTMLNQLKSVNLIKKQVMKLKLI